MKRTKYSRERQKREKEKQKGTVNRLLQMGGRISLSPMAPSTSTSASGSSLGVVSGPIPFGDMMDVDSEGGSGSVGSAPIFQKKNTAVKTATTGKRKSEASSTSHHFALLKSPVPKRPAEAIQYPSMPYLLADFRYQVIQLEKSPFNFADSYREMQFNGSYSIIADPSIDLKKRRDLAVNEFRAETKWKFR